MKSQEHHIEKLTVEDGLPSNTIFDIVQDTEGLMWFASREGLSSYDGYEVVGYKQPLGEDFDSRAIFSLFVDLNENIWCGTWGDGIHIFNKQTLTFKRFSYKAEKKYNLKRIRTVHQDKNQMVWFLDILEGIFRYNPSTDSLYNYKNVTNMHFTENLNSMLWDTDSTIILGFSKRNRRYIRFNTINHSIEEIFPDFKKDKVYNTWEMVVGDSLIYAASRGGGIMIFNRWDNSKYLNIDERMANINPHIRTLVIDNKGKIWAGGASGLYKISLTNNLQFESLKKLTSKSNSPYHLNAKSIVCTHLDISQNLWLGTVDGGVNIINFNRLKFNGCNSSTYSNWSDGRTPFIAPLNEHQIILGGQEHAIFDIKSNQLISPYTKKNDLTSVIFSNNFSKYRRVKRKDYYLHLIAKSFHRFVFAKTDLSMNLLEQPIVIVSDKIAWGVSDIHADKDGNFLLCSYLGLTQFKPDYEKLEHKWDVTHIDINKFKFSRKYGDMRGLHAAYISSENDLWLASMEMGILKTKYSPTINPDDSLQFTQFLAHNTPGLKSNVVTTIFEDSRKTIWFGTAQGLTKYKNGIFVDISDSLGMISFKASAIE
ncbi:MAG: hypothetical protein MI922_13985, partial [Bacteroidales bacterium]|nr:hypothetical protein [Bacteroidales bacterium]